VSEKGPADFVSEADRRTEAILTDELRKARPTFGFLREEHGEIAGEDPDRRWIIDPLDGTTNFLHGIPHFAISVALEQRGEVVAGVVYDALRDEVFWAEKGAGAYVNRQRLRVSARHRLAQSVIATGIPFGERAGKRAFSAMLSAVMERTAGVRRFGAASLDLAWVAAGRYDAFWEVGLSPWDVAAGIVLVREAGGFVTDLGGGPGMLYGGTIVAGNNRLHGEVVALLGRALAESGLKAAD
jgi:myo-inositol-1(or 4)-monophosphatase